MVYFTYQQLVAPLASKLSNYEDFDEDESVSSDREVCQKSGSGMLIFILAFENSQKNDWLPQNPERNSLDKEESGKDVSKGEKSKSYKKPTKPDSKNSKKVCFYMKDFENFHQNVVVIFLEADDNEKGQT